MYKKYGKKRKKNNRNNNETSVVLRTNNEQRMEMHKQKLTKKIEARKHEKKEQALCANKSKTKM